MTAKQQKEFKKEIKNYLDLEYENLNQLNTNVGEESEKEIIENYKKNKKKEEVRI